MEKKEEVLKWIARRQAVWTRKLNKVKTNLSNMPIGVMAHIDAETEKTTALRVLEELANIKGILKNEQG